MSATLETLAAQYARLRERILVQQPCCAQEDAVPPESFIQELWNKGFNSPLVLADGRSLQVLQRGEWNHGAGPDFKDALLSIEGLQVRGDIEIHVTPHDWDLHRHATDPAYAHVILHVTWESQPEAKTLPPAVATLMLKQQCTLQPRIEPPVYPCQHHLDPCQLNRLVEAAGFFRLQVKTRVLMAEMTGTNALQAFYEALLGTLGFQRNVQPFRQLAKDVPYEQIATLPALQKFATLAGVGGLLQPDERAYWALWYQTGVPPALTAYGWDFRGLRPANHPRLRLAGGIGVLQQLRSLLETDIHRLAMAISEASGTLMKTLQLTELPIGQQRANAIVTNLIVPYRLAVGTLAPEAFRSLPGETVSAPMREAWLRLTGTTKHLPKDALHQQGLLQIYKDYCHNATLVCSSCPLCAFE